MTVYSEDSEVSRLNERAHHGPVEVGRGLFELIEQAVVFSRETDGAYDVTAGALSEAWGFVRGPKRVPDPMTLADARRGRAGSICDSIPSVAPWPTTAAGCASIWVALAKGTPSTEPST